MNAPANSPTTVHLVVSLTGLFAMTGLLGTIYLCHLSTNPELVGAAVKMIQTDPSSAMAALNLLRADAAVIAIVSGLTGVAIGSLTSVLNNTRSHAAPEPTSIVSTTVETSRTQPTPA